MTDLSGYTIAIHWDGPTMHVECLRCSSEAQATMPNWRDRNQIPAYREWLRTTEARQPVGYGTTPATVAELLARVEAHEVEYHS